jgi:hypothetical protein
VTVASDARYTGAGPRRLHLNACGCGRIENIAGRKPATVECARERALNCREAGSERAVESVAELSQAKTRIASAEVETRIASAIGRA